MKRFTLFLSLLIVTTIVYSQSPRMVLQEEFTSSTCGPCASANPTFHTWMGQHPDIYTTIFWHCNWPSPGNDPMYLANVVDNAYRIGFYAVNSIPWALVDGNVYDNNGGALQWSVIQNRSAVPSPFTITLEHQLNATQDSIFVTMLITCTQALTASLVAHNVVVEDHVHFTTAPGTNGEKDFYNVMKKMLPSKDGTSLPVSFVPGDYSVMKYAWKLASVYDVTQLSAVSFVQNKTTKEIYQTANSTTTDITMPFNNDAEVMNVSNYSTVSCTGKISPVVEIRNNGNNPITSMEIKYKVNDEPVSTFTWSGNLAKLGTTSVALPEYVFTPIAQNTLKIFSNNPNNLADEYPKNDTATVLISGPTITHNLAYLTIRTDNAPGETTWDVRDETNTVIKSGGPYTLPIHMYKDTIDLPTVGCYTFTIYDAGGNGICCSNGTGVYTLSTSSPSTTIKSGNIFGSSEFTEFSMDWATGIKDIAENSFNVYPNPFTGTASVAFTTAKPGPVTISLYNLFGELVKTIDMGILPSGNHELTLDASTLAAGIYFLKLQANSAISTKKIALEK